MTCALRGAPSRSQPETPMPPDQVACLPDAAGIFHHGLSVRCVPRKGLTTYWTVPYLRQGQVVVRNKYGGYWNKTRSTVDSGGFLKIPCMICKTNIFSINRITAHYTLLCHTGHDRPNGDRRQAHAYPRQRLSRILSRHACEAHEDDYHHKYIHFQQQGNYKYAIQVNDCVST